MYSVDTDVFLVVKLRRKTKVKDVPTTGGSSCALDLPHERANSCPNGLVPPLTLEQLWRRERDERRNTLAGGSSRTSIDPDTGERTFHAASMSQASTLVDRHLDRADLLHSYTDQALTDHLERRMTALELEEPVDPALIARCEFLVESIDGDIWRTIANYASPADTASLAYSSKSLLLKLGFAPWEELRKPENKQERIEFLKHIEHHLPFHLLCSPCGQFHKRSRPTQEKYKADFVNNPVFACPKTRETVLPRTRLAHGREMPFAYVQLAVRAWRYAPAYGIDYHSLSRQWKSRDSGWSHQTRFHIHRRHLLMRVVSQCIAPPSLSATQERLILYDRDRYLPYFSVCAHWRDGDLMKLTKCAMSHIPEPQRSSRMQFLKDGKAAAGMNYLARRPDFLVSGCGHCAPMRRCAECPSEYLIEVKMVEDQNDPVQKFKHAIQVTRWTDLGDGSSPMGSQEWASINGLNEERYDSFANIGSRALSGIFESGLNGVHTANRLLNLNPTGRKRSELWYD